MSKTVIVTNNALYYFLKRSFPKELTKNMHHNQMKNKLYMYK